MSMGEDAATVLDQFVHDVANIPAEIAHLLEEIEAKDQSVAESRSTINNRDNILQKHIKASGIKVRHAKEEQYTKQTRESFARAQALQEEKVALSSRACFLLDRQVKKLDLKIRDLINDGGMQVDATLPSLLGPSPGNLADPTLSLAASSRNSPMPGARGTLTPLPNPAIARIAPNNVLSIRAQPAAPVASMQPAPSTTASVPRPREQSASAQGDVKRRRQNPSLGPLPMPSSNLAQQMVAGPGTPKAATPGSRAGSAGPRTRKPLRKVAPHQQGIRKAPGKGHAKKSGRRATSGKKGSPSITGDDDSPPSDLSGSENAGDAEDAEGEEAGGEEDGEDNRLYCTCQRTSFGDMVACDNMQCPYEWFHWECVGLSSEPKGNWICDICKKLPNNQLKLAPKNA
ncbi:hypothetical protein MRB53_040862 [Persea americana]|nr:hypothetical protein MRB53_040862 [Persea americana]